MSNLPPGCTGSEWEIAGPDYEKDVADYCPTCEEETDGLEMGYRRNRWWVCGVCGDQIDLETDGL